MLLWLPERPRSFAADAPSLRLSRLPLVLPARPRPERYGVDRFLFLDEEESEGLELEDLPGAPKRLQM